MENYLAIAFAVAEISGEMNISVTNTAINAGGYKGIYFYGANSTLNIGQNVTITE